MVEEIRELSAKTGCPIEAEDSLLTKGQVAQRLNVSLRTVESWMNRRLIPYVKIRKTVRFIWPDVQQALKKAFGVGYGLDAKGRSPGR